MTADRDVPGAAHCAVCRAASTGTGEGVLARWYSVEASKLYALLQYRAELDAAGVSPDRDAPGAKGGA